MSKCQGSSQRHLFGIQQTLPRHYRSTPHHRGTPLQTATAVFLFEPALRCIPPFSSGNVDAGVGRVVRSRWRRWRHGYNAVDIPLSPFSRRAIAFHGLMMACAWVQKGTSKQNRRQLCRHKRQDWDVKFTSVHSHPSLSIISSQVLWAHGGSARARCHWSRSVTVPNDTTRCLNHLRPRGGYFARGALDLRISDLRSMTVQAWVNVGVREEEGPLVTVADLKSGTLDSLRVWRTADGIRVSYTVTVPDPAESTPEPSWHGSGEKPQPRGQSGTPARGAAPQRLASQGDSPTSRPPSRRVSSRANWPGFVLGHPHPYRRPCRPLHQWRQAHAGHLQGSPAAVVSRAPVPPPPP
jgi:hypothetical protein